METYEFFKKEFEFKGKHADMISQMWIQNDYEHSYFKRLIDIYIIAPIIGFRLNRKASTDYSTANTKSIFTDQMNKEKDKLDFILQMILLLEHADELSSKDCVDIAFRGIPNKEKFDEYNQLFNDYARGGIEELYEELVIKQTEPGGEFYDDKAAKLMRVLTRFKTDLPKK